MSALALIAGRGRLPDEVASALVARGQEVLVAALEGNSPERLQPDLVFRVETLGSFLNVLQAKGVSEICMAGSIGRPDLDPSRLDAATVGENILIKLTAVDYRTSAGRGPFRIIAQDGAGDVVALT